MSYEPERPAGASAAAEKTNVPGILLLIVGILNALAGAYWVYQGVVVVQAGSQVDKDAKNLTPEQKKQIEEAEKALGGIGEFLQKFGGVTIAGGALGVITGVITLLAGLKMRSLQSRGLCMTGSILAMNPCSFPCCLLGIAFGIWALVVLANPEVKAAFR